MAEQSVVRVGIAVVINTEGECLVGIRPPGVPLAGKHEFPGGKCKPGESPRDAAVRECSEETGVSVDPVQCLYGITHRYDHATVELEFWRCLPVGPAVPTGSFRWCGLNSLSADDFPDANRNVIDLLKGRVTPSD